MPKPLREVLIKKVDQKVMYVIETVIEIVRREDLGEKFMD